MNHWLLKPYNFSIFIQPDALSFLFPTYSGLNAQTSFGKLYGKEDAPRTLQLVA